MTDFAWLIEAPGTQYLGTRSIAHYPEFHWTTDPNAAIRFMDKAQADGVLDAVRRMDPALFAFERNLVPARPTEHGWLAQPTPPLAEEAQEWPGCKHGNSVNDCPVCWHEDRVHD